MVDFKKELSTGKIEKKKNPIEIYETLDRGIEAGGPLRTSQENALNKRFNGYQKKRDLIIKLNTGSGKTLTGLLILQAKINMGCGNCLYVCPNKYLAEQTQNEAKKFGIHTSLIDKGGLNEKFLNGEIIGITHIQKLFNGKTIFGLGTKSIPVDTIILDDSHACIDSIQESFTISLPKGHDAYNTLLQLFEEDIKNQGEGTFLEIIDGCYDSFLPIPYWSRIEKKSEVIKILQQYNTDIKLKFTRDLIKDNVENFEAYISGSRIEISPYISPIDMFGTFANAKQRILMSATTHDDSFVIKGLGFSKEAVENSLGDEGNLRSGEKMLIIPKLIDDSLDREKMLETLIGYRERSFGIISLVNSFSSSQEYKELGAKISNKDSISENIKSLRNGEYKNPIVFVNRYDGIENNQPKSTTNNNIGRVWTTTRRNAH